MRLKSCITALVVTLLTFAYVKSADFVVSVTCADELELYTDASMTAVATHDSKTTSKQVNIADTTKVISIKGTVKSSTAEAGILASVQMVYPGDYITDATWKCSYTLVSDWTTANFDDSGWAFATVIGNNNNSQPTGLSKVNTIDKYANWIWTTNYKTQNRHSTVYCRGHIGISRSYDNYGRLFAIGFMENKQRPILKDIKLLFSTLQPTDVTVRISVPLMSSSDSLYFENVVLTVKAGEVVTHVLHRDGANSLRHTLDGQTDEKKAVRVISTANVKVVGENQEDLSTDLFLVIPINSLGMSDEANEYFMICHDAGSDSRMLFVAAYDNTLITIDGTADLQFNGTNYNATGTPFDITLNKYESIQFASSTGCTGTNVKSNKPISAFSGNRKSGVKHSGSADHLVEQMIPLQTWGKEYIITPLAYGSDTREAPSTGVMAIYVIVAAENDTSVTVKTYVESTGSQVGSPNLVSLNKGASYNFDADKDNLYVVTSDKGITVMQISTTKETGCKGDPWAQVIPPIYQYERDYSLLTPVLANGGGTCPAKHYITIIVPDSEKDGIILEGGCSGKTLSTFKSVPGTDYVEQTLEIDDGSYCRVRHNKTNVSFAVYFYGYGKADSYATMGGTRMAPIFGNCTQTQSNRMGDGLDNDCNGKIDDVICPSNDINVDCAPPPPVEGGWSSWTNGTCVCPVGSVAGASGTRTDTRECNNPVPRYNGSPCEGSTTTGTLTCTCDAIDGGYSDWDAYGDCTPICGGIRTRQRYCNDPTPAYGGNNCTGNATETQNCDPCTYSIYVTQSDNVTCSDNATETNSKDIDACMLSCLNDNNCVGVVYEQTASNPCRLYDTACNQTSDYSSVYLEIDVEKAQVAGFRAQSGDDSEGDSNASADSQTGSGAGNTVTIAAAVIGGVAALGAIAGCTIYVARRRKKEQEEEKENERPKTASHEGEDLEVQEVD